MNQNELVETIQRASCYIKIIYHEKPFTSVATGTVDPILHRFSPN